MFKTIGNFKIDKAGIKSVLLHCLMIGIITCAFAILTAIQAWLTKTPDAFGLYQSIVVLVIGTAGAYLKKWAFEYDVPMIVPPAQE